MTFERLTIRNSDGTVSQPTRTTIESVFYRLAEYEDTDMRPEDIAVTLFFLAVIAVWSKAPAIIRGLHKQAPNAAVVTPAVLIGRSRVMRIVYGVLGADAA